MIRSTDAQREWFAEARRLEAALREYFRGSKIDIAARPACSGGPRVGYTWRGTFVVQCRPQTFGMRLSAVPTRHKKTRERRFVSDRVTEYLPGVPVYSYKPALVPAIKWIDHISRDLHAIYDASYLISLYRRSGLIPEHVAKKHARRLLQRCGQRDELGRVYVDYADNQARHLVRHLAMRYIFRYSRCPGCGARGFEETSCGFACTRCGYEVYETDNHFMTTEVARVEKEKNEKSESRPAAG